jgi:hypothetical protein
VESESLRLVTDSDEACNESSVEIDSDRLLGSFGARWFAELGPGPINRSTRTGTP